MSTFGHEAAVRKGRDLTVAIAKDIRTHCAMRRFQGLTDNATHLRFAMAGEHVETGRLPTFIAQTASWQYVPQSQNGPGHNLIIVGDQFASDMPDTKRADPALRTAYGKTKIDHEVLHARYTDRDLKGIAEACKKSGIHFLDFNMGEDVRIEELGRKYHAMSFGWTRFKSDPEDAGADPMRAMLYARIHEGVSSAVGEHLRTTGASEEQVAILTSHWQEIIAATSSVEVVPIMSRYLAAWEGRAENKPQDEASSDDRDDQPGPSSEGSDGAEGNSASEGSDAQDGKQGKAAAKGASGSTADEANDAADSDDEDESSASEDKEGKEAQASEQGKTAANGSSGSTADKASDDADGETGDGAEEKDTQPNAKGASGSTADEASDDADGETGDGAEEKDTQANKQPNAKGASGSTAEEAGDDADDETGDGAEGKDAQAGEQPNAKGATGSTGDESNEDVDATEAEIRGKGTQSEDEGRLTIASDPSILKAILANTIDQNEIAKPKEADFSDDEGGIGLHHDVQHSTNRSDLLLPMSRGTLDHKTVAACSAMLAKALKGPQESAQTDRAPGRLNCRRASIDDDRPYDRLMEGNGRGPVNLLAVFDLSGSMAGTPETEAKIFIGVLSDLAKRRLVEGHIALSMVKNGVSHCQTFALPLPRRDIERIAAYGEAEGLAVSLEKTAPLSRKADITFIYSDANITDVEIDKSALHRRGVFPIGVYCGGKASPKFDQFVDRTVSGPDLVTTMGRLTRLVMCHRKPR